MVKIKLAPDCPYCGNTTKLVNGAVIYPHRPDLRSRNFYKCAPCGAYVGTHKGTIKPLGKPANAELRTMRRRAHAVFDPIWKKGTKTRREAYAWLSKQLGIFHHECHIGMFDEEKCRRVLEVCVAEDFSQC